MDAVHRRAGRLSQWAFRGGKRRGEGALRRAAASVASGLEALEPRTLMTNTPFISEFMASNSGGLRDQDNQASDWIEIQNPTAAPVNLDGYYLTDSRGDLTRWRIPAVTIPSSGYLVVFASDKDRAVAGQELHTDFNLEAGGEYLALVAPDGATVLSEYDYPEQVTDVSYGIAAQVNATPIIGNGALVKTHVPTAATPSTWKDLGFNDSAWRQGTTGVGYDTVPTPPPYQGFTVRMVDTSGGDIPDVGVATRLLDGNTAGFTVASNNSVNWPVVDFDGWGFGEDQALPNGATVGLFNEDPKREQYAVRATANVFIPAGTYTMAVGSDDGFRLKIPGVTFTNRWNENGASPTDTLTFSAPRGHDWTTGTFTLASGINTTITLDVYERGGGDSVELAFATGTHAGFNGAFQLVRDNTNGWQLSSPPLVLPPDYRPHIGTNVQGEMLNVNTSAYMRLPFNVLDPLAYDTLRLRVRYDDGFVAYLNGVKIAERNAPASPAWNSGATQSRADTDALAFQDLDIPLTAGMLRAGANVLAVHGLNDAVNSDDFLIYPALNGLVTLAAAEQYFTNDTPGAVNDPSSSTGVVADTTFDVDRGFYNSPFFLSIHTPTAGAQIRYTLDGSAPTAGTGLVYGGPVLIDKTTVVRAAAFKPGFISSDVDTQTYIFLDDVIQQSSNGAPPPGWPSSWINNVVDYGMDPDIVNHPEYGQTIKDDLKAIPTMNLTMDLNDLFGPSGIYSNPGNDGRAWERPGSVELIYPDGSDGFQVDAGIRIRGGFSRQGSNPKHAFRVFMRSEYGDNNLDFPLFGPDGLERYEVFDLRTFQNYSWSFGGDPSGIFMRDQLNRDMQIAMGHEGERGDYYHLYVNGQYWGLYNSAERPEAETAAGYFGGEAEDYDVVKSDPDIGYSVEATDGDMIAWQQLWESVNNIRGITDVGGTAFNEFMALQGLNPDGSPNPNTPALLDVDNLIDYMLVIYYGGNLDAPISAFLGNTAVNNFFAMRPKDGRFGFRFFVHDAEHTFLNAGEDRTGPFPAGQTFDKSNPQWFFQQLWNVPEFKLRVADHIREHMLTPGGVLTAEGVTALFNKRRAEIDRAVVAESARWGDSKRSTPLTRNDWLNATNNVLTNFIPQRTQILLNQLNAKGLYPTVAAPNFNQYGGQVNSGFQLTMTSPGGGTIYYRLDGQDPRLPGGGLRPGTLTYTAGITLNASTTVTARVKVNNDWSALTEGDFRFNLSALNVSEVMYNPAPNTGQTPAAAQEYEYVELVNNGSTPMQLGGIKFTNGIDFTFPSRTLAAGARVLVVKNLAQFRGRYGDGLNSLIAGQYTGALDNAGESVTLLGPLGEAVFDFEYSDEWFGHTDGGGYSLVVRDPAAATDTLLGGEDGWRASDLPNGGPGVADPGVNPGTVVFNEAMANYTGPGGDWIELFNPTNQAVNIGGWFLSDSATDLRKYRIPDGTLIPAGGYLVFNEVSHFGRAGNPGVSTPFDLSDFRAELHLTNNNGGEVAGYREYADFAASPPDTSFGRIVKSGGGTDFTQLTGPTLGTSNALAVVGPVVINEVMYNPLGGHEFIELRNITSQPVKLYLDDANPSVTWRFSDGLEYAFPAGATIPANGYALVVPIDAAAFRTTYNIPASVPVYGNYSPDGTGALGNNGADLKLMRPLSATVPAGQTTAPFALVDKVKYNDGGNWPAAADGTGPSIARISAAAYGNDSVNWKAGPTGGTPGRANVVNAPAAPSGLQVSGSVFTNRVTLRWTDNAGDEEQFRVERSTDGVNFTQIGTTGANALTFNSLGLSPSTTYHYRVRAANGAGLSAYSNVLAVTTASPPPPGNGVGLQGEYFDGTNFDVPFGTPRLDAGVNYSDGGGQLPYPGLAADTFSVRWTGKVQAQFDETYTFYTNSDDGVRLWVNNQLVVDNWTDHGPTENSGTISLAAGQKYDVRLEFYENGGGAVIQLSWSSPSTPKALVPASQLFPPAGPAPAAPTLPAAAGTSSNTVRVRWADGSSNEQGFKVEVSPNGSTGWTLAGTAPANATSFVVGNLNANTTYHFRVRATNETGDSAATSVVNAQTSATGAGSPAGHWMLDETAGTNAADASGNNFTGLLTDVSWSNEAQTGARSASFGTSGTQQIRVADGATPNLLLNPAAAITLAAWVKPTDWNGNRRIIQKGASDNQYRLLAENGLLKFHVTGVGEVTATLPAAGAWHHVAATYDGGTLKLYVNGNVVASKAASGDIPVAVSSLYLGARSGAVSGDRFVGLMDDVRLYTRALTDADIRTLVSINGAPAAAPTGLTATPQRNLQMRLTWNDTNRNEYGYRVERKTGAAGAWADIGFAPGVAAAPGTQVAFVDSTGLQNGLTYFYRVRAANNTGNGPYSGEASATATFTTLPAPWQSGDVGPVGQAGSADFAPAGGAYTVRGSGADVFGTSDGFHYVYQTLASGGTITARVSGVQNTDPNAKAGVMIRQSLAANSAYAYVGLKPNGNALFERRLSSGASSVSESPIGAAAPYWVRLVRNGNTITAFTSANGSAWAQFGNPITVSMGEPVLAGLAVTAHNNALLNTSTFDNVSITQAMNLTGTGGDDSFHVNLDAGGNNVQVWQNRNPNVEAPSYVLPRSAFTAFSINGGGGNDTLSVDFANGNPIPGIGLTFEGAAGSDVLTVTGGAAGEAVSINGAQVTFGGGAINVGGTESVTLDGGAGDDAFTVNAPMAINPLIVGGAGANSLTVAGGVFTMIGSPAATSETMDVTVANGARINFAAGQTLRNLTLNGNAVAALTTGGAKALRLTGALSVAPQATLDLADNDLVVQSTPANRAAALTLLRDLVRSGRAGGAWTGKGIVSSLAAASAMRNVGLAVLLNDNGSGAVVRDSFGGEPADTSTLIVKYTWNGDADANGLVNGDDYMLADRGFLSTPVNGGWYRGDFNFDGRTNIDDYFLIDVASRTQSGPLAGTGVAPSPVTAPEPQGLLAPQSMDDSLFPDDEDDDELQPLW